MLNVSVGVAAVAFQAREPQGAPASQALRTTRASGCSQVAATAMVMLLGEKRDTACGLPAGALKWRDGSKVT